MASDTKGPNEKQLECLRLLNWGGPGKGPYLSPEKAYCSRRERVVIAIVRWEINERGAICNPRIVGEIPRDPSTLELVNLEPEGTIFYRGHDNDELLSAKDKMEIQLKAEDNRGKSAPIPKGREKQ